jgi:hypothetical protein
MVVTIITTAGIIVNQVGFPARCSQTVTAIKVRAAKSWLVAPNNGQMCWKPLVKAITSIRATDKPELNQNVRRRAVKQSLPQLLEEIPIKSDSRIESRDKEALDYQNAYNRPESDRQAKGGVQQTSQRKRKGQNRIPLAHFRPGYGHILIEVQRGPDHHNHQNGQESFQQHPTIADRPGLTFPG